MFEEASFEKFVKAVEELNKIDDWFENMKPEELEKLQAERKRIQQEAERYEQETEALVLKEIFGDCPTPKFDSI